MSAALSCTVKLLNKAYQVRCPANEESSLLAAGERLDQLMRKNQQKFPALDNHQLLLLAALETSHALIKQEQKKDMELQDVDAFIQSLEQRLEKVAQLGRNMDTNPPAK